MENSFVVCTPCFEAVQNFGLMDWVGVGILLTMALIFMLTKKNFFSMTGSTFKIIQKLVEFLTDLKSKKGKPN